VTALCRAVIRSVALGLRSVRREVWSALIRPRRWRNNDDRRSTPRLFLASQR
jgi:hypothetical protein